MSATKAQVIDTITVSRDEWDRVSALAGTAKRIGAWRIVRRAILWTIFGLFALLTGLIILGATLGPTDTQSTAITHGTDLQRCNAAMVTAGLATDLCEPLAYPGGVMPNPPVSCDKSGLFCTVKLNDGSEYLFDTDAGRVTFIHQH